MKRDIGVVKNPVVLHDDSLDAHAGIRRRGRPTGAKDVTNGRKLADFGIVAQL